MYKNESLNKYCDDLAARLPAPGGGSASALTACLGAALIGMVINFTLGKPKYAKYENELKGLLLKAEKARLGFLDLVDRDVMAFKSRDMRQALDIPLMICRLCLETASMCPALITKGNKNLISDVAVAAVLLESGFVSAMFNVEINLKFMDDKGLVKKLRKELKDKENRIKRIRLQTEVRVGKIIRR